MRAVISLHLDEIVESTEAAGWSESKAVEKRGLGFVGFGDTAEGDLALGAAAR